MILHKLIVRKTVPTIEIIREIQFNSKGLSLIIDETGSDKGESGNNVGKTTAIKVIDLCLGAGSVRELYYDTDTHSENEEIKKFLHDNKIQAELILKSLDNVFYHIKRDLILRGKFYIDNVIVKKEDFKSELKQLLFGSSQPYPTFRQLISKFVRLSTSSEDGMIKYLPSSTTNEQYNTIYSYLFNLLDSELVSNKDILCEQLSECRKTIDILQKNENITSISILRQKQAVIDSDLVDLYNKRKQLSYMETYKDELENKRKINAEVGDLQEKISMLDFEINTINESLEKLAKEKSNVDLSILKNIYSEAKMYIPKLQKSFEDVVSFHNIMIQNRIDFINEQLNSKVAILDTYTKQINNLLDEKEKITLDILDEGLLDELNILNNKIEELRQQKGGIENSIELLEKQKQNEKDLSEKIQKINSEFNDENIESQIAIFNSFFTNYCFRLYEEKYFIAYNRRWKEERQFPITVDSLEGKVGTGKKKALIVAFDLAYMKYAEVKKIASPNFVVHDKLENTHFNQLETIFKICEEINGQYIIPILRERIDKVDQDYLERVTVLKLSEKDKFFRV